MATSPALHANINGSVVLSKMQDLSIPGPKHEATSQHLWSQAVSTVALISIALACVLLVGVNHALTLCLIVPLLRVQSVG